MTNTNKTYFASKEGVKRDWYVVDARDKVLGRLAAKIARVLMGKHKPIYTPHTDTGDFIVVLHADEFALTGKKSEQKKYRFYSNYPGGYREVSVSNIAKARPGYALRTAVRKMLPKTRLGRQMLRKMKVFKGENHPHQAQQPKMLEIN